MNKEEREFTARSRHYYAREAGSYDKDRFSADRGEYSNALVGRALAALVPSGDKIVLDAPTGTGRIIEALAFRCGLVIGLDATPEMLAKAVSRVRKDGLSNASFVLGDIAALPFEDGACDAVISLRFFHLVPRALYGRFIAELERVLKPGGVMILEFANPLYGLVIPLARRLLFRRSWHASYVWPWETGRVAPEMRLLKIKGIKLPFSPHINRFFPRLARFMERLQDIPPFAYFCSELWIVARKGL